MKQEIKIRLERHGGVTLLEVKGDVTSFSEPFLKEAYNNATSEGANKIVLKFEESAYINSGGLAVLIQLLAGAKRNNQEIGITGLSDHFKKIFTMVGITKLAKIYSSVDEVVKGLSGS